MILNKKYNKLVNLFSIVSKINKNYKIKKFNEEIICNSLVKNSIYFKNFSFNFYKNFNYQNKNKKIPTFFNSSSLSIIKHPIIHDRYILNIRCVNYNLNLLGASSINSKNDICFTSNVICILDFHFNIIYKHIIHPDINDVPYIGIEDIKLFNFNNKIYYIGSAFDKVTNKIRITSNEFKLGENYEINYITPTFETNFNWEKNWVFFENNDEIFIVYKWYPISICKIDYVNKKLNMVETLKTPEKFHNFRGSSNGVLFDNKIWFIVHSQVSFNEKKHYCHRFVVLNKDLTIYGYSKQFKFENYLVEFCIGFELSYNNNFIITYSTLDRTSNMIVLNPEFIKRLINII